jgi:hypothetical protein
MLYNMDDDNIHVKIHLRDRLSAKFEHYQPNQKQALDAMLQLHQQRLVQAQQAQMQQAMMMEQMKAAQKEQTKQTAAPAPAGGGEAAKNVEGSIPKETAGQAPPVTG